MLAPRPHPSVTGNLVARAFLIGHVSFLFFFFFFFFFFFLGGGGGGGVGVESGEVYRLYKCSKFATVCHKPSCSSNPPPPPPPKKKKKKNRWKQGEGWLRVHYSRLRLDKCGKHYRVF